MYFHFPGMLEELWLLPERKLQREKLMLAPWGSMWWETLKKQKNVFNSRALTQIVSVSWQYFLWIIQFSGFPSTRKLIRKRFEQFSFQQNKSSQNIWVQSDISVRNTILEYLSFYLQHHMNVFFGPKIFPWLDMRWIDAITPGIQLMQKVSIPYL